MNDHNNEPDRLLRVTDIVKPHGILPICRSTFHNLRARGVLPPGTRLGPRVVVFSERELKAAIAKLKQDEPKAR